MELTRKGRDASSGGPEGPLSGKETARCIVCKQEITAGASLCPLCKSHQRAWKNHLQYGAGIATLVVLILSATTWLWGKARLSLFYRDDVRLVSCDSLHSAVVVNRGDGEVFISHLVLTMPGRSSSWEAKRLDFQETLQPGRFLRRQFPAAKIAGNAEFVRDLDAVKFNTLIARAAEGDSCLELVFFESSDSFLRDLMQMVGPGLNTFAVGGYLEYQGMSRDSPVTVPVMGTGALRWDFRPECHRVSSAVK